MLSSKYVKCFKFSSLKFKMTSSKLRLSEILQLKEIKLVDFVFISYT